jgi:hypothetical protein
VNFGFVALICGVGLFLSMLAAAEVGRRIGMARLARHAGELAKGGASTEAALFALFGLLIAFTFSGAASRFEDRRHLIADEANAIATAFSRVDLLPSGAQPPLRELFRRYVDVRYSVYRGQDDAAVRAKLDDGAELQDAIWEMASLAVLQQGMSPATATLMLGSLNQMIEITITREMATRNHPPLVVFLLLGGLSLVCSLLIGYETSPNPTRTWLHTVAFAAIVSFTVYVIIDLEFPRFGFIRVDSADEVLAELRESMQ